jgi:hypothetical protein
LIPVVTGVVIASGVSCLFFFLLMLLIWDFVSITELGFLIFYCYYCIFDVPPNGFSSIGF